MFGLFGFANVAVETHASLQKTHPSDGLWDTDLKWNIH